jgi:large subunit ribosomal protein L24
MQTLKFTSTTIKKGDMVQVIAGKEKGKTGKVSSVLKAKNRIVVEGLNLQKRHTKPTQANPQGGIITKEGALHYSNVLIYCSKCNKGVRVKSKVAGDKKSRVCAKCSTQL